MPSLVLLVENVSVHCMEAVARDVMEQAPNTKIWTYDSDSLDELITEACQTAKRDDLEADPSTGTDPVQVVVLAVIDGKEGFMATYGPQVATVQKYASLEDAACFNVGSFPDYDERGKPYRVVAVPFEHWHEFEVHGESIKGKRDFRAYPSTNPTISPVR